MPEGTPIRKNQLSLLGYKVVPHRSGKGEREIGFQNTKVVLASSSTSRYFAHANFVSLSGLLQVSNRCDRIVSGRINIIMCRERGWEQAPPPPLAMLSISPNAFPWQNWVIGLLPQKKFPQCFVTLSARPTSAMLRIACRGEWVF
jgi:hypothetical protein